MEKRTSGLEFIETLLSKPGVPLTFYFDSIAKPVNYDFSMLSPKARWDHYACNYTSDDKPWDLAIKLIDLLGSVYIARVGDDEINVVVDSYTDMQGILLIVRNLKALEALVPNCGIGLHLLMLTWVNATCDCDYIEQRAFLRRIGSEVRSIFGHHIAINNYCDFSRLPVLVETPYQVLDEDNDPYNSESLRVFLNGKHQSIAYDMALDIRLPPSGYYDHQLNNPPIVNLVIKTSRHSPWSVIKTNSQRELRKLIEQWAHRTLVTEAHKKMLAALPRK